MYRTSLYGVLFDGGMEKKLHQPMVKDYPNSKTGHSSLCKTQLCAIECVTFATRGGQIRMLDC